MTCFDDVKQPFSMHWITFGHKISFSRGSSNDFAFVSRTAQETKNANSCETKTKKRAKICSSLWKINTLGQIENGIQLSEIEFNFNIKIAINFHLPFACRHPIVIQGGVGCSHRKISAQSFSPHKYFNAEKSHPAKCALFLAECLRKSPPTIFFHNHKSA